MNLVHMGSSFLLLGVGTLLAGYAVREFLLRRLINQRMDGISPRYSPTCEIVRGAEGSMAHDVVPLREQRLQRFCRIAGASGITVALLILITGWASNFWSGVALIVAAAALLLSHVGAEMLQRQRAHTIVQEFPNYLDLLQLMIRAGASLDQAFRMLAHQPEGLFPELTPATRRWVEDVDNGFAYSDAFRRWAERIGSPLAEELARIFTQGLESGTDVASRVMAISELIVQQRLLNAREAAGRKVTQLTIITVAFFLPPFLILIAGPGMDSLTDALHSLSGTGTKVDLIR